MSSSTAKPSLPTEAQLLHMLELARKAGPSGVEQAWRACVMDPATGWPTNWGPLPGPKIRLACARRSWSARTGSCRRTRCCGRRPSFWPTSSGNTSIGGQSPCRCSRANGGAAADTEKGRGWPMSSRLLAVLFLLIAGCSEISITRYATSYQNATPAPWVSLSLTAEGKVEEPYELLAQKATGAASLYHCAQPGLAGVQLLSKETQREGRGEDAKTHTNLEGGFYCMQPGDPPALRPNPAQGHRRHGGSGPVRGALLLLAWLLFLLGFAFFLMAAGRNFGGELGQGLDLAINGGLSCAAGAVLALPALYHVFREPTRIERRPERHKDRGPLLRLATSAAVLLILLYAGPAFAASAPAHPFWTFTRFGVLFIALNLLVAAAVLYHDIRTTKPVLPNYRMSSPPPAGESMTQQPSPSPAPSPLPATSSNLKGHEDPTENPTRAGLRSGLPASSPAEDLPSIPPLPKLLRLDELPDFDEERTPTLIYNPLLRIACADVPPENLDDLPGRLQEEEAA